MKQATLYLITSLIISFGYAQNNSSEVVVKNIIETESHTITTSDGEKHVFISEINEIKYNPKGEKTSKIRKTYFNNRPHKTLIVNFIYNKNDRISHESNFIVEDSSHYRTNYYYVNNQLVEKSFEFIKNEKESKYIELYSYNINNELITSSYDFYEKYVDSDFYLRNLNIKSLYNKKGKVIEMDWTESDSTYKYNKFVYKWNKKELISKEKEYNKGNDLVKVTSFKYVFDKHNNWIVKKSYVKKSLVKTMYREIEYYN